MIHQWELDLPTSVADVRMCLLGGQMFRFKTQSDGCIVGVDGSNAYHLELVGDKVKGQSNTPVGSFRSLLRLEVEPSAILEEVRQKGPELAPFLAAFPGLRITRSSSPAEVFIGFLCSANNNLHRIMPMVQTLGTLGEPLPEGPWGSLHSFPSLEILSQVDPGFLRSKGFGYRAPRIVEAAAEAQRRGGDSWLQYLAESPYETAHQELTSIHGIGSKLADCICLFGLDKGEAVPIDTHVWAAACQLYFPEWQGKAVTDLRYKAVGDLLRSKFGSHAGWAHQFLFSSQLIKKRPDIRR